MCEIEVEPSWMLRNVSEIVGAFRKETWARFQLVDSISGLKSEKRVSHHLKW